MNLWESRIHKGGLPSIKGGLPSDERKEGDANVCWHIRT